MNRSHNPILVGFACWRHRRLAAAHRGLPDFFLSSRGWIPLSLVLVATVFGPVPAVAQIGCVPNTPNYPCVYVANSGSNTVAVINATTNSLITTVPVGASPAGLAITPNNAFVYVANSADDTVSVIETATGTVTLTVTLSGSPSQVAITPNGALAYVAEPGTTFGTGTIEIINTTNHTVTTVQGGVNGLDQLNNPTAVAFTPDGTTAYAADTCTANGPACADVIDVTTGTVSNTVAISNTELLQPASIAITPDGSLVCMSIELTSVGGISVDAALGVAFISTTLTNAVSTLDLGVAPAASNFGFGITPNGTLYATEPGVLTAPLTGVAVISTIPPAVLDTLTVGSGPTGVAVSPSGAFVYVTNAGDGTISVINTSTNPGTVFTTPAEFSNPQGVAAMPTIFPAITTQPATQTIHYSQTATLSVVATGTAPLSYQWYQGLSGDVTAPITGAASSSFTTPALTTTASYWVQVSNVAGSVNSNTATETVVPPTPPAITTQPASQIVNYGQTATLSVLVSSTAPLTYQWYQGQSGNTSAPVAGAVSSAFVTPALTATTSYWVQVADAGGSVNSSTATMTVAQAPFCSLSLQGNGSPNFVTPFSVTAIADCTDPLGESLNTSIDWGDDSPPATGAGGSLRASHIYAKGTTFPVSVTVSSTDTSGLRGTASDSMTAVTPSHPLSGFAGQTLEVSVSITGQAPLQVAFECTTVTDSNRKVQLASALGITCSSTPPAITFTGDLQPVTIQIATTGAASGSLVTSMTHRPWSYASWLPLVFLGVGFGTVGSRRKSISRRVAAALLAVLLLLFMSCGGGFTAPEVTPTPTPAGSYQVTVVDTLVPNQATVTNFVQTSLIVPLSVSAFQ
jgi:YVTN family beta-propeller protein